MLILVAAYFHHAFTIFSAGSPHQNVWPQTIVSAVTLGVHFYCTKLHLHYISVTSLMKLQSRIYGSEVSLRYFVRNEWEFETKQTDNLPSLLDEKDR